MEIIDETTKSPAFRACISVLESMGPFSSNPKVNEAYMTIRLLGVPEEEAKEMIEDEINRRLLV